MQLVTLFGICLKAVNLREDNKKRNEPIKTILTIITDYICSLRRFEYLPSRKSTSTAFKPPTEQLLFKPSPSEKSSCTYVFLEDNDIFDVVVLNGLDGIDSAPKNVSKSDAGAI
jgi:hypothetical protein